MEKELEEFNAGRYPVVGQIVYFGDNFEEKGIMIELENRSPLEVCIFTVDRFETMRAYGLKYYPFDVLKFDEIVRLVGTDMNRHSADSINYYSSYLLKKCLGVYRENGGEVSPLNNPYSYTVEKYIQRQKEDKFWAR